MGGKWKDLKWKLADMWERTAGERNFDCLNVGANMICFFQWMSEDFFLKCYVSDTWAWRMKLMLSMQEPPCQISVTCNLIRFLWHTLIKTLITLSMLLMWGFLSPKVYVYDFSSELSVISIWVCLTDWC